MSETNGQRLVREIIGKRLSLHDRVALAVRIDGLINIMVGAERSRCFDIALTALGSIQKLLPPTTREK